MSAGLAVASAGLLLMVPGALTALAVGLRGHLVVAAAPALSVGGYALAVVLFGAMGVPWEVGTVVPLLLAVPALLVVCRRPWRRRSERSVLVRRSPAAAMGLRSRRVWMVAGWLIVWALVSGAAAYRVVRATRGLVQPQQYWDGMFHTNAVRFIADSKLIESAALAPMAQPENAEFLYPNVFHGIVALLVQSVISDVPTAVNAVLAVLPSIFAAGLGVLAWVVCRRPLVTVAATVLGTAVSAFPYDLMLWGPLWPYAMAVALVPAAAGLVLLLVRSGSPFVGAAAVLAVLGVVQTQPAAGVACVVSAVLLLPPVVREQWAQLADRRARARHVAVPVAAGAALLLLCLPLALGFLTQPGGGAGNGVDWVATQTPGAAIGQLLTFNQEADRPQWWLAALLLVGVVVLAARGPGRMLLAVGVVFLVQYVLAAAYDTPLSLRLTSLWWNDKWRFAALFAAPAVLVAAVGVQGVVDRVGSLAARGAGRLPSVIRRVAVPTVAVLATCGLLLISTVAYGPRNESRVAGGYGDGPTWSSTEATGYQRFADIFDGQGVILNDPNDGSALAYAYFGLPVVFKSPLTPPYQQSAIGADRLLLLSKFDEIDENPAVRAAAERLDVRWVVIGNGFTAVGQVRAQGLDDLDGVQGLEVAFRNRDMSVYHLVEPGHI